jgi:predicted ArsR family transcriptional regulator
MTRSARLDVVNEVQRFSPQRQARALGDPTRHAIFRYVEAAGRPLGVAELTEHFELNHNTVRQHLAQLCDAGLVVESIAAPTGPGRRRLEYQLARGAGAWGRESPYRHLSMLLLDVIREHASPYEIGRRAGRDAVGSAPPSATVADGLEELAAQSGFEPRRVEHRGSIDLVLHRCPYADAAVVDPDTICDLHRGIADGAAEVLGGDDAHVDLTARDPLRAGCRLRIETSSTPGRPDVRGT